MTDSAMLKFKIKKSGLKMTFIADKLGISLNTLSRKTNRKAEFTAREIMNISAMLNLTTEERDQIFFSNG